MTVRWFPAIKGGMLRGLLRNGGFRAWYKDNVRKARQLEAQRQKALRPNHQKALEIGKNETR